MTEADWQLRQTNFASLPARHILLAAAARSWVALRGNHKAWAQGQTSLRRLMLCYWWVGGDRQVGPGYAREWAAMRLLVDDGRVGEQIVLRLGLMEIERVNLSRPHCICRRLVLTKADSTA